MCWAAAAVCVLHRIVRGLQTPLVASDDLRHLADAAWVREHGAEWVARLTGRGARVSNAARQLKRALSLTLVPDALTGTPLRDRVHVGTRRPDAITTHAVAALTFDAERLHWTAATRDRGLWWVHDDTSSCVGRQPPEAEVFVWLQPEAPKTPVAAAAPVRRGPRGAALPVARGTASDRARAARGSGAASGAGSRGDGGAPRAPPAYEAGAVCRCGTTLQAANRRPVRTPPLPLAAPVVPRTHRAESP
jgi:hypothetical protein